MTLEAKCENAGHVKANLNFNSKESQSVVFTKHHAVGLDGKTKLTTSTTNNHKNEIPVDCRNKTQLWSF